MNNININSKKDKILIVDFGSQVSQLIARRIRESNVYCELHPFDNISEKFLQDFAPKGIIFSGGGNSVYDENQWKAPDFIFEKNIPILGICYGMQTIANQLGGKVENAGKREFGYAKIELLTNSLLFENFSLNLVEN